MPQLPPVDDVILRRSAQQVTDFSEHSGLWHLLDDLKLNIVRHGAVGIAAPQIAIPLQVAVVLTDDLYLELINPLVTPLLDYGEVRALGPEGCLSLPERVFEVLRLPEIRVRYQDRFGHHREHYYEGRHAIIIQHECDHLSGMLIDRRGKEVTTPSDQIKENVAT
jgi:peptide deformylase